MANQLADYESQLEQVEAAILAEPDNEELLKLKEDLLEVINLTKELSAETSNEPVEQPERKKHQPPQSTAHNKGGASSTPIPALDKPVRDWKVGDRCLAIYSSNGKYYEAVIDAVNSQEAVVAFVGFETKEINSLLHLRKINDQEVLKIVGKQSKIKLFNEQREKRKEKAMKRVKKQQELELSKEKEKTRWHDFSKRASAKSYKGVKRPPVSTPQLNEKKTSSSSRHVAGSLPRP